MGWQLGSLAENRLVGGTRKFRVNARLIFLQTPRAPRPFPSQSILAYRRAGLSQYKMQNFVLTLNHGESRD
jgi:hypothetical protein